MLNFRERTSNRVTSAIMIAAVAFLPRVALAQNDDDAPPAATFAELVGRDVIHEGDKVHLTLGGAGGGVTEREATFVSLDADAITVIHDDDSDCLPHVECNPGELRAPEHQVLRIVHAPRDPLWKGAVIGGGIGILIGGLIVAGQCSGDKTFCTGAVTVAGATTAIGLGVGVAIDYAVRSSDVVYVAPAVAVLGMPKANEWSLAPTFQKQGYGAVFTFEFGR